MNFGRNDEAVSPVALLLTLVIRCLVVAMSETLEI
jgi:hypothetical protein